MKLEVNGIVFIPPPLPKHLHLVRPLWRAFPSLYALCLCISLIAVSLCTTPLYRSAFLLVSFYMLLSLIFSSSHNCSFSVNRDDFDALTTLRKTQGWKPPYRK